MDKKLILTFVPPRTRNNDGGTLAAVIHFFNDGCSVAEAAQKAGITKQAANAPIQRAKHEALKHGCRKRSVWLAPDEEIVIRKKKS